MKLSPASDGRSASDGLRVAADWFDLYDKEIIPLVNVIIQMSPIDDDGLKEAWARYAHAPGDEVQNDLRRWADELEETDETE